MYLRINGDFCVDLRKGIVVLVVTGILRRSGTMMIDSFRLLSSLQVFTYCFYLVVSYLDCTLRLFLIWGLIDDLVFW